MAGCRYPLHHSHSPYSAGKKEKIRLKHSRIKIRTGRLIANNCHRKNTSDWGKFHLLTINNCIGQCEIKNNTRNPLSPQLLCWLSFTLSLLTLPPLFRWCSEVGNRSCGQSFTAALCHSFLHILSPCCSMGSLPHKLLQQGSFPSFRNRLLQCGFPTGHRSYQESALA